MVLSTVQIQTHQKYYILVKERHEPEDVTVFHLQLCAWATLWKVQTTPEMGPIYSAE